VKEEGAGATAVPEGQNSLPSLGKACGVYGRNHSRDRGIGRSNAAEPTEHFNRFAPPHAPAKRSNRVGGRALVERRQRDFQMRFDENVWRERERAVQPLAEQQPNDRPFRFPAHEGLDLTQGGLSGEDLTQPAATRLQRCDDVV
jgi:hypothetical protein